MRKKGFLCAVTRSNENEKRTKVKFLNHYLFNYINYLFVRYPVHKAFD